MHCCARNARWLRRSASPVAFAAAAPMDMLAKRLGAWKLMLHGVLFAVYSDQTGPRGRDKIFSTNWLMLSGSRRLGPGRLTLRSMLSLEPATVTKRRYPLLFQEG